MKRSAWNKFVAARDQYRLAIDVLCRRLPKLRDIQQKLVDTRPGGPGYAVETPIVYNATLDDIQCGDTIRLILVADNPGRREQAEENRRYLVGPSGKIAEGFFRNNPSLGIDFRSNAVILNKTPIHTPRTGELRELCRLGGTALAEALADSQRTMARLLLEFHRALAPVAVWITGYSEMRRGGIFEQYTETLRELYPPGATAQQTLREQVLLFRHFSMNQFTIDIKRQASAAETLEESLRRIGAAYRLRILGW